MKLLQFSSVKMCQCYVNGQCRAFLWLVVITFVVVVVSTAPQFSHDRILKNTLRGNVNGEDERRSRQIFPFGNNNNNNNPGQQILDRIKSNLEKTSANLGLGVNSNVNANFGNLRTNLGNLAGQAFQNTYGILNRTLENLNQLSMGNFGNILPTPRPSQHTTLRPDINNGGITQVPNHSSISPTNGNKPQPTTPTFQGEDNNISHYVDGNFPVILLKPEDVRK